jgi:putative PIN family toxin of toxin-antitoxin system
MNCQKRPRQRLVYEGAAEGSVRTHSGLIELDWERIGGAGMKVVLDTNVLIAALRSRHGAARLCLEKVLRGNRTAVVSVALVFEYEAVMTRPEQLAAFNLTADQVRRLLDGLCSVAEHTETMNLWRPLLRDADDEMVVEAAAQGGADVILTFNVKDFAGCERVGVKAMTPGTALSIGL